MDIYERLIEHWRACGVEPNTGVSADGVAAFEARHNVVVPPDFKLYLQRVNGMQGAPYASDNNVVSFYAMADFEDFPLSWPNAAPDSSANGGYFVFADVMVSSYYYAARLTAEPQEQTPVFVTYQEPELMADNFAEFLERYLQDEL